MNFNDEVFEVARVYNSLSRPRDGYKSDSIYGAFDSKVYAFDIAKNAVLVYDDCAYVEYPSGKSEKDVVFIPRFVWISLDMSYDDRGTIKSLIHKKK